MHKYKKLNIMLIYIICLKLGMVITIVRMLISEDEDYLVKFLLLGYTKFWSAFEDYNHSKLYEIFAFLKRETP